MAQPKKQKRIIAPSWADLLHQHIEAQPRGYQAKMAIATGCSAGLISRMKNATIDMSEWVEDIARYCDLPIPPLAIDEAQSEMLVLAEKISEKNVQLILDLMRGMADSASD